MSNHRPSRRAWPEPLSAEEAQVPIPQHCHPAFSRALAVIGVFMALLAVGLGMVAWYARQDHEYVQGRGEYRDREAARQDEQFREGICDLLDSLPAGPLLDSVRAKYGCGPGLPFDELPPEVQQGLAARDRIRQPTETGAVTRAPAPTTAAPQTSAAPPAPAPPVAPRVPVTTSPTPVPTPAPASPTAAPLINLTPITQPVCDALGVCL